MARLLEALVQLDNAARVGARVLGTRSTTGQVLQQAVAELRQVVAPAALHELALDFDPKVDLMRVFSAAEAAGLSWPDLMDALNRYHELQPGK